MSGVFQLGRLPFASGENAEVDVAYWTCGQRNAADDNTILVCHGSSGSKDWALPYCRPGGALDPERWFIVSVDLPGGGESSRRSRQSDFPARYSVEDCTNVLVRCLDALGVRSVRAFCGPSMACLLGLDLGVRYPERTRGLVLWAGGWRSDRYAQFTIETMRDILSLSDSQAAFRAAVSATLPALTGRDFIEALPQDRRAALLSELSNDWARRWRADELSARYAALAVADIGATVGGEAELARRIACPVIWLQVASDALFPIADIQRLAASMRNAELKVLESSLGHLASIARPGSREFEFFDRETARFLEAIGA